MTGLVSLSIETSRLPALVTAAGERAAIVVPVLAERITAPKASGRELR